MGMLLTFYFLTYLQYVANCFNVMEVIIVTWLLAWKAENGWWRPTASCLNEYKEGHL